MWLTDFFRRSIGMRIFGYLVLAIVLVALVVVPVMIYLQGRALKDDLLHDGSTMAELLAYSVRTAVFVEDRILLNDAVEAVKARPMVSAVAVYSGDAQVLVQAQSGSFQQETGPEALRAMIASAGISGEARGVRVFEQEHAFVFICPVMLAAHRSGDEAAYFDDTSQPPGDRVIGHVAVSLENVPMRKALRAALFRTVSIAVILFFAAAVAISLAVRRAVRPLRVLTHEVKALGVGEDVRRVDASSSDEVGRLAEAFNAMAGNLRRREEEKAVLEDRLVTARKMEALGTFSRGVAHDFSNILATVRGALYILESRLPAESGLDRHTGQIGRAIARAAKLVQGLLTFSRTNMVSLGPVDLNSLVRMAKSAVAESAGGDIEIRLALADGKLEILGDHVQLEQVIMNLCMNARDAMPDGGAITITTGRRMVGQEGAGVQPDLGEYAVLRIADSGIGMDEEVRRRIFEPFFTTKVTGKGTGLGLAIVYGIVEHHRGRIAVESEPGAGAVFEITIPLLQPSATIEARRKE